MDGFPANTRFSVCPVHLPTRAGLFGEHQAIAEIAIVRDSNGFPASLFLVGRQVRPEILRVIAVKQRERYGLAGLVGTIPKNNDTMEIVATRCRGPFKSDHCSKTTGFVVLIRDLYELPPDGAGQTRQN